MQDEAATDETGFIDKTGEPILYGDTVQLRGSDGSIQMYAITEQYGQPAICLPETVGNPVAPAVILTKPIAGQLVVVARM